MATRAHVAEALSYTETGGATAALRTLASDGDAGVRENALRSLGSIGNDMALDTLIETAESGSDVDRKTAIGALALSESARARESLAEFIERGDEASALAAIGAGGDGSTIARALVTALDDLSRSDAIRKAAAEQLRTLGVRLSDSQAAELDRLAPLDS